MREYGFELIVGTAIVVIAITLILTGVVGSYCDVKTAQTKKETK